jgi:Kef-type K+ transport system membrane component KefB
LSTPDTLRLVIALAVILVAAHGFGRLATTLRQPAVVGEIVAGILLGPSCLRLAAPGLAAQLFPAHGAVTDALDALYQIGQLLLIFLAGAEVRIRIRRRDLRTGASVLSAGLVIPFAVGIGWGVSAERTVVGPDGTELTTALIMGLAMAVAAIPVISRIMLDLGISDTRFGRIVMLAAVAEDIVLYIVLAVVLGLGRSPSNASVGLWQAFGDHAVVPTVVYYTVVSVLFLAACATWGPRALRRLAASRANLVAQRSPVGFRLAVLCALVAASMALGINSVFGALAAGVCVATADVDSRDARADAIGAQAWGAIRQFSMAFFVPVFFVLVGMDVNLGRGFSPVFLGLLLLVACGSKLASVYAAARLAGEPARFSGALALALNARGTVGIVLAGTVFQAGLIDQTFFTSLVLLSVLTSQFAGVLLARTVPDGPGEPGGASAAFFDPRGEAVTEQPATAA